MKIVSLIRNPRNVPEGTPCVFNIGSAAREGGHTVTEILYCRDGYANGPGKEPVYVVKFGEIGLANQIPVSEAVDIGVDPTAGKKSAQQSNINSEAAVDLPA